MELPEFAPTEIDWLLKIDFVSRSVRILSAYIVDGTCRLALFHGSTLAFKNFGGPFMMHMLTKIGQSQSVTILTATSWDNGVAVAHAFYGFKNMLVVILYYEGKINPLQEKLFCTLCGNIYTMEIEGDFNDCQALVKQAFDDEGLKQMLELLSANSINISWLLVQIYCYFEAVAQPIVAGA